VRNGFNNPQNHFLVVVQEPGVEGSSEEVVVGTAEWRSPAPGASANSQSEQDKPPKEDEEKRRAEQMAKMPDFMDKERVMEMLQRFPVEAARVLGEGAEKTMWSEFKSHHKQIPVGHDLHPDRSSRSSTGGSSPGTSEEGYWQDAARLGTDCGTRGWPGCLFHLHCSWEALVRVDWVGVARRGRYFW